MFKEEIVIRLATGHHNVQDYLIQNRYLDYFTVEELETLLISEEDPNLLVLIISYLIENNKLEPRVSLSKKVVKQNENWKDFKY